MIRTEECVSPKHPDKMCDRISDTILDFYLQETRSRYKFCGGNGKVFVTGEVTSKTEVTEDDIKSIVHNISIQEDVIVHLTKQSPVVRS